MLESEYPENMIRGTLDEQHQLRQALNHIDLLLARYSKLELSKDQTSVIPVFASSYPPPPPLPYFQAENELLAIHLPLLSQGLQTATPL